MTHDEVSPTHSEDEEPKELTTEGEPDGDSGFRNPAEGSPSPAAYRLLDIHRANTQPMAQTPPKIPNPGERVGTVIDGYKLLELRDVGGFGKVFKAAQCPPLRGLVALKVLKLGRDTEQVIARFETESQMLAVLDHPNIARVIGAGATESGRPYFVMEYVKGIPLTEFCDEHQLSIGERLDLFRSICSAVQHAHSKLIIHRDLKPQNILVGLRENKPIVKVIDFGIAKAMSPSFTDRDVNTRESEFIGSWRYASPEQANKSAVDIDVRSDVYSLGVILFELLTGSTPVTREEIATHKDTELPELIRTKPTPKPLSRITDLSAKEQDDLASARNTQSKRLRSTVSSDLGWIVLKALEKKRERRYASVEALELDIENYLARRPTIARRPSVVYESWLFMQRHKNAAASASAIFVILVAAVVFSSVQAVIATRAREDAEAAQGIAERAQALAEKNKERAERSLLMGGNAYDESTDLAAEMLLHLNRSFDSEHPLVAGASNIVDGYYDPWKKFPGEGEESQHMRAIIETSKGVIAQRLGRHKEAKRQYDKALDIRQDLLMRDRESALYLHNVAGSLDHLGDFEYERAEGLAGAEGVAAYENAIRYYRRALGTAKKLETNPKATSYWRHEIAVSYLKIGDAYFELSLLRTERDDQHADLEDAREYLLRGFPIAKEMARGDSEYIRWQDDFARYLLLLCEVLESSDDLKGAERFFAEGREHLQRLDELGRLDGEELEYYADLRSRYGSKP